LARVKDEKAGALPSQQARPRGGGQAKERDGATRAEAESYPGNFY